jgi:pimeloyl-ACP methyl ester carboxylesterase
MTGLATTFRALDGLTLSGTLLVPAEEPRLGVVLVHGGGVTREEGGFFARLAAGLCEGGIPSLRYDLRGHGESEGRQEDATLAGHLNDIRVALGHLRSETGVAEVALIGASFGGGLCAYYAARRPGELARLVLLNPNLTYKRYYIDERPNWTDDRVDDEGARMLAEHGAIALSPTLRHGRALLNEVFWVQPFDVLAEIEAPTLIVHGTRDTFISVDSSRAAVSLFKSPCELVEIDGAQHGFAVHDDPQYRDPQSQQWQAFVISTVVDWLSTAV